MSGSTPSGLPIPPPGWRHVSAAKEATLKALGYGLGGMRMADIEVVRADDGRPELVLHGDASSTAAGHGVGRWLVSLSHTDNLAQATVVALAQ